MTEKAVPKQTLGDNRVYLLSLRPSWCHSLLMFVWDIRAPVLILVLPRQLILVLYCPFC